MTPEGKQQTVPYRAMLSLTVCLVGVYFTLVSTGFGPYLTDGHGFRQTQTAITARYFSGFSDFLTYQTPDGWDQNTGKDQ